MFAFVALQTAKIIQEKKKKNRKVNTRFSCNVNVLIVLLSFFNTACYINFLLILHEVLFSDVLYSKDVIKSVVCGHFLSNFTISLETSKEYIVSS